MTVVWDMEWNGMDWICKCRLLMGVTVGGVDEGVMCGSTFIQ